MKAALIIIGLIFAAVFVVFLYSCLAMAHECDELENYEKEVDSNVDYKETSGSEGKHE